MTDDEFDRFTRLYAQIAELKVVKCRIAHERVKIDPQTNLPIPNVLPDTYARIGFCSPEERKIRLACGHTMARYLLQEAITIMDGDESELRSELDEVTNKIHSLDHQKGDAEKYFAQLTEQKDVQKELETAAAQIEEIEIQHTDCAEKIGKLRNKILDRMKFVIERDTDLDHRIQIAKS